MSINDIPTEVLSNYILSRLDGRDFVSASSTCRRFRRLVELRDSIRNYVSTHMCWSCMQFKPASSLLRCTSCIGKRDNRAVPRWRSYMIRSRVLQLTNVTADVRMLILRRVSSRDLFRIASTCHTLRAFVHTQVIPHVSKAVYGEYNGGGIAEYKQRFKCRYCPYANHDIIAPHDMRRGYGRCICARCDVKVGTAQTDIMDMMAL